MESSAGKGFSRPEGERLGLFADAFKGRYDGCVVQRRSVVEMWRGNGMDSPLLWSESDFDYGEAQEETARAVIIQASLVFLLIVTSLVPRGSIGLVRTYSGVLAPVDVVG